MIHVGAIAKNIIARSAEREAICDKHGVYTSKLYMGRIWSKCGTCAAEEAKLHAEREAAEQSEKDREKMVRILGAAGIPDRFQDRTLGSFDTTEPGQRQALEFAESFAAEFAGKHSGRCAVFFGNAGTGKTHLACGVARHIMRKYNRTAIFTSVSKMARRIREAKSFNASETESSVILAYSIPHLLILDEVGLQSGTDAESRSMFDVINERYENRKPTLFLTNLDVAGFRAAIGERLFDRMKEDGGEVVAFTWSSRRGRNG